MPQNDPYIEELRRGIPAAYEEFVTQFEGPLYRFFLCDHRNHHLAQEQTAETFSQFVRSVIAMQGSREQLAAYVFAIARRVQRRRWRDADRRPVALDDAFDTGDHQPTPDVLASHREQLGRVLHFMSRLDEPMRQVLALRFVEGYSIHEVARCLEMPVGTVKSHIHRGRLILKQMFDPKGNELGT